MQSRNGERKGISWIHVFYIIAGVYVRSQATQIHRTIISLLNEYNVFPS